MKRAGLGIAALAALGAMVLPASSQADTVTLNNNTGTFFSPTQGAPGPGDEYPSTVTGPAGTVNDVNVSVNVNHANIADLDVQLVSPAGTGVFLFSDTCGGDPDPFNNLKFDDAASMILPTGPCNASLTYNVTNQNGFDSDIYSPPAPADPPLNALSFFNGQASGGSWRLFGMDDTMGTGGNIVGWSLTLDFTPTPATTPPVNTTPAITPVTPVPKVCKKKKKKGKKSAEAAACKKKKKKK